MVAATQNYHIFYVAPYAAIGGLVTITSNMSQLSQSVLFKISKKDCISFPNSLNFGENCALIRMRELLSKDIPGLAHTKRVV